MEEDLPTPESLRLSISENWEHARHAQDLRDRLTNLYWVSWGAVLAYLHATTTGANPLSSKEAGFIFGLLALLSALVLSSTLKWTAEFANHVAGVYHASVALGLVTPRKDVTVQGWFNQILSGGASLPYPPFRGYMALPLNMPVILNVGPAVTVIVSVGLAASTGMCVRVWFGDLAGGLFGFITLSFAVLVAAWVVHLTDVGISERDPNRLPTSNGEIAAQR
jgi:hypothetical protein